MQELHHGTSKPHDCSYLPGRVARQTQRLVTNVSAREYDDLLAQGWRRFGALMFQASCEGCSECVPIRVRVADFEITRSQKRVKSRNEDLELRLGTPRIDRDRLDLFDRYHKGRSDERGWPLVRADVRDYFQSFVDNAAPTAELELRLGPELVGISYFGVGENSLNAIYTFTDPQHHRRSLGTHVILTLLERAASSDREFVYLGYRVEGCASMAYKSRFRPHELMKDGRWASAPIDSEISNSEGSPPEASHPEVLAPKPTPHPESVSRPDS